MDYLGNIKPFKGTEKFLLIQYIKNQLKDDKDEYKANNIDKLREIMDLVEMFYDKKGQGKIKEEVVRKAYDISSDEFLNQMIPFVIQHGLLKNKTIKRKINNYFKQKKLKKKHCEEHYEQYYNSIFIINSLFCRNKI